MPHGPVLFPFLVHPFSPPITLSIASIIISIFLPTMLAILSKLAIVHALTKRMDSLNSPIIYFIFPLIVIHHIYAKGICLYIILQ